MCQTKRICAQNQSANTNSIESAVKAATEKSQIFLSFTINRCITKTFIRTRTSNKIIQGSTQVNKSDRIPGNGIALESDWKNSVGYCKFHERSF
ncbi:unnamed protein product [Adineta ricciae]|uniref:Uncharacterized protein n=1 Tax=Adineta ricciae TaxID=249248 RepID=A0A815AMF7_ADIRI|nr:unnamed protein product [Adineta ricciae]